MSWWLKGQWIQFHAIFEFVSLLWDNEIIYVLSPVPTAFETHKISLRGRRSLFGVTHKISTYCSFCFSLGSQTHRYIRFISPLILWCKRQGTLSLSLKAFLLRGVSSPCRISPEMPRYNTSGLNNFPRYNYTAHERLRLYVPLIPSALLRRIVHFIVYLHHRPAAG